MPFELITDASDFDIGACLEQHIDKKSVVIAYLRKALQGAKLHYTTTKKEFLAIVVSLDKFRYYLLGHKVLTFIDHVAIKYLLKKSPESHRLISWTLLL